VLYTAQDLARFCEVDLKTIHHWTARGKIPHFRTEGRHLRFRRNDVLRFLRAHGYPVVAGVLQMRPIVALALTEPEARASTPEPAPSLLDDLAKKLTTRFDVLRFGSGVVGVAHLLSDEPDALILALDDPSLAGARSIAAIKRARETAWVVIAAVGDDEALAAAREAGAEITIASRDLTRIGAELARALTV
jgi:excisionase family DNA binding protein